MFSLIQYTVVESHGIFEIICIWKRGEWDVKNLTIIESCYLGTRRSLLVMEKIPSVPFFGKTFHIPCPPWGYRRWTLGMMPSLRAAELSQVVFSWSEFRVMDFVLVWKIHWLLWSLFGNYLAIQFSLKSISAPCVFGHTHEKVIKPYLYLIFKQQRFCP